MDTLQGGCITSPYRGVVSPVPTGRLYHQWTPYRRGCITSPYREVVSSVNILLGVLYHLRKPCRVCCIISGRPMDKILLSAGTLREGLCHHRKFVCLISVSWVPLMLYLKHILIFSTVIINLKPLEDIFYKIFLVWLWQFYHTYMYQEFYINVCNNINI